MILGRLFSFFAAAAHRPRLPEDRIRALYPRYRWRILEATFLGYAAFYLVRNNLGVVARDIHTDLCYTHAQLGDIMAATALSYGLGKFVMGILSDRCNPRVFMATGLLLTALCNFAFGAADGFWVHLGLWILNGFVQGMGWPPCGRALGHWFSLRERGLMFSIWNTSHNLGGGLAGFIAAWAAAHLGGWRYAFYFPGILAVLGAFYLFRRLRDTPQSVGLPPIEEYHADPGTLPAPGAGPFPPLPPESVRDGHLPVSTGPPAPPATAGPPDGERELTTRELLFARVLVNPWVWVLAAANFFCYIARYSMLDWGPTYLREVKGVSLMGGGWATMVIEFGGIPSTILLGWLSDRLAGRRGLVACGCMGPILLAFAGIMIAPPGMFWLDMILLMCVGLLIYPVINLIVIMALDLTGKKAIGTAAGLIGLFGYLGRAAQAKGLGWLRTWAEPLYGLNTAWNLVLGAILVCSAAAILLLALTVRVRAHPGR